MFKKLKQLSFLERGPVLSAALIPILWGAFLVTASCRADNPQAGQVRALIDAGAKIIDVRTPGEFARGAYPGAVNVPLQTLKERIGKVAQPNEQLVLYCASGKRSSRALGILGKMGYTKAINAGGLRDMPR